MNEPDTARELLKRCEQELVHAVWCRRLVGQACNCGIGPLLRDIAAFLAAPESREQTVGLPASTPAPKGAFSAEDNAALVLAARFGGKNCSCPLGSILPVCQWCKDFMAAVGDTLRAHHEPPVPEPKSEKETR